ncbi:hypothetical protein [Deinococcus sp.]|nr:hypothetical protein [Deinococcus sp.]
MLEYPCLTPLLTGSGAIDPWVVGHLNDLAALESAHVGITPEDTT